MTKRTELLRVMAMLRAAGWSSDQITRFYAQINDASLREVINAWRKAGEIAGLKGEMAQSGDSGYAYVTSSVEVSTPAHQIDQRTQVERSRLDTIEKASSLLRTSGISTTVAVKEVSRILRTLKSSSPRQPPPNNRKNLNEWLARVSRIYTLSELLFAANAVAKIHGDSSSTAWSIRSDDSSR